MRPLRALPVFGLLTVSLMLLPGAPAMAQVDPWEFEVYPYLTTPRGMLEVESLNAFVAKGHNQLDIGTSSGLYVSQGASYNALELTYGLTDRIEAAVYVNLAKPDGTRLRFAGSKFRLRGRLFDQGVLPVDLGWYAEFEQHATPAFDSQRYEFEFRPIIEKDMGRFSVQLNPIFEKAALAGPEINEKPSFGYAAGIYLRWKRSLSPGLEAYGGAGEIGGFDRVRDQQHYLFPVIRGELPRGLEYNFGVGFGLTPNSDHVIVKFNIGLEKFVGTLFRQSSDSGWFF